MCEPVTIMAALAVATAAASSVSQIKAANRQTKAINEQQKVVREENRQQASAETFDRMRAARREQGTVRAAAGEAGLSIDSGSVEMLLMDSAMQSELSQGRILANLESRNKAVYADTESALSKVQKPTALGVGLNIGTAAVGGWANMDAAAIKKSTPGVG